MHHNSWSDSSFLNIISWFSFKFFLNKLLSLSFKSTLNFLFANRFRSKFGCRCEVIFLYSWLDLWSHYRAIWYFSLALSIFIRKLTFKFDELISIIIQNRNWSIRIFNFLRCQSFFWDYGCFLFATLTNILNDYISLHRLCWKFFGSRTCFDFINQNSLFSMILLHWRLLNWGRRRRLFDFLSKI